MHYFALYMHSAYKKINFLDEIKKIVIIKGNNREKFFHRKTNYINSFTAHPFHRVLKKIVCTNVRRIPLPLFVFIINFHGNELCMRYLPKSNFSFPFQKMFRYYFFCCVAKVTVRQMKRTWLVFGINLNNT